MINPVWLQSFCTLVEVGHFTRTAERLNMTQSGVSQHVRKLEGLLGQLLLQREGKRFTLTDAGQRLYHEGRHIIRSLSDLEEKVGFDPEFEGEVRIASPGSVGLKLYRHLLGFQKQQPKLAIDYRFAPNDDVEWLIAEHKVDIGFMTRPSRLADVSCKAIAEEELLLVTPAKVKDPQWEHLQKLGFIDHPDGAHHAGLLLGANFEEFQHVDQFARSGFSNQINLILEPVAMGLGFTVLPAHAVSAFKYPEQLSIHRLPTTVKETLYLGSYRFKYTPNRVKSIMAEINQCLK